MSPESLEHLKEVGAWVLIAFCALLWLGRACIPDEIEDEEER